MTWSKKHHIFCQRSPVVKFGDHMVGRLQAYFVDLLHGQRFWMRILLHGFVESFHGICSAIILDDVEPYLNRFLRMRWFHFVSFHLESTYGNHDTATPIWAIIGSNHPLIYIQTVATITMLRTAGLVVDNFQAGKHGKVAGLAIGREKTSRFHGKFSIESMCQIVSIYL